MVVVTGAGGFIGGHLVMHLKSKGFDVIGVGRGDEIPSGDILVHLAEPNTIAKASAAGTLLDVFGKPFKKIIYASSLNVLGGSNAYTAMKIAHENVVLEKHGTVLRLSNVYGAGMSDSNVLSTIINQFKSNSEAVILNTLSPVRDYIYIQDVVSAFEAAIISKTARIFNVGTGVGTSVAELVELIREIFQSDKEVVAKEEGQKSYLVSSIEETLAELNWSPTIKLPDGLKLTVEAMR
jgi:nucleoside-diphosphate-sugar epimerase